MVLFFKENCVTIFQYCFQTRRKPFTSVLNNRLRQFLEKKQQIADGNQAYFRKLYSCSDSVHTLYSLKQFKDSHCLELYFEMLKPHESLTLFQFRNAIHNLTIERRSLWHTTPLLTLL